MANKSLYLILAVGVVLLAAIFVYDAVGSKPGASNFYMATDMNGKNRTTVFSPANHVYIFFNVSGIEAGTRFQSRWYGLDLEGQDPAVPLRVIDYTCEGGASKLFFELSSIGDWPKGNYKVEVYMNDAKVGEQTFSVQ
ncbi:MAG: hypothetical protein JW730_17310 [Anaerolineales bacterium]|nr:hypothetical protein [Anaerolineales bacterium]